MGMGQQAKWRPQGLQQSNSIKRPQMELGNIKIISTTTDAYMYN